ncbi:hypothetical protein DVH05_015714 [Phytophthora capsici]|nr:hypothetical protein DVH05_015714 [Phytophthora capsici]
MVRKNRKHGRTTRVASTRQLTINFVHASLVLPIQGNPALKDLLGLQHFRQQVERQAELETGIQAACLDWTEVVVTPPCKNMLFDGWKNAAEDTSTPPRVIIGLKGPTTPPLNVDQTPPPRSAPTEPERALTMKGGMNNDRVSAITREPTMAQVMAKIAAQDDKITAQGDKITAQGVKITEQNATIKRLRQDHSRLQQDHSREIGSLRRNHSNDIDKLIEKLGETDERQTAKIEKQQETIEKQQETIKKQGQQIKALISSSLHLLHRKMLDCFREELFDEVGRKEDGRELSTKELIDRVREKKPHELSDWTLDRFSAESGHIHLRPTKEEARLVFDSNLGKDDANYQELFRILFPE